MDNNVSFHDSVRYKNALEYFNLGKYRDALKICREILTEYPYDHPTLFLAAVIFEKNLSYERAVLLIERIYREGTSKEMELRILPNLAMDYCELRQYYKALYWCQKGLQIYPNNFQLNNNAGYILNQQQRCQESLPYLQKAIKLKPTDWGAWGNIGEAYFKLGLFKEAMNAVNKACNLLPSGHPKRIFNERRLIEIKAMIDAPYISIKKNRTPINADDYIEDALLAEKYGKFDDALILLDSAQNKYPKNAVILGIKASILLHLGKLKDAEKGLRCAIEIDPQCWNFYNDLAHIYLHLDIPANALENLIFSLSFLRNSDRRASIQSEIYCKQMIQGLFFRLGLMSPEVQKEYISRKKKEIYMNTTI